MAIRLYDLAGADEALRFSPHCWRTRMALAHKGLQVETVPWRFTEKEEIAFSKQGAVPVIVDGDRHVVDSWKIAQYLEETYPERPSLFGGAEGRAVTRFVNDWVNGFLLSQVLPLIITDVHGRLHEKDKAYFRESREERFGRSLEEVADDSEERLKAFRAALQPLRMTLSDQPFLGGETALYADYSVFGLFQWARCVSDTPLLATDDPVHAWRERLLDAFDGLARNSPAQEQAAA